MPLEQAVLDHRVLERISDGETTRMRVLVVGARRDSVNHLLAVARRAGLHPELVDLSAFAMIRALYVPRRNDDEAVHPEEPAHVDAAEDVGLLGYEGGPEHTTEANGEAVTVAQA